MVASFACCHVLCIFGWGTNQRWLHKVKVPQSYCKCSIRTLWVRIPTEKVPFLHLNSACLIRKSCVWIPTEIVPFYISTVHVWSECHGFRSQQRKCLFTSQQCVLNQDIRGSNPNWNSAFSTSQQCLFDQHVMGSNHGQRKVAFFFILLSSSSFSTM